MASFARQLRAQILLAISPGLLWSCGGKSEHQDEQGPNLAQGGTASAGGTAGSGSSAGAGGNSAGTNGGGTAGSTTGGSSGTAGVGGYDNCGVTCRVFELCFDPTSSGAGGASSGGQPGLAGAGNEAGAASGVTDVSECPATVPPAEISARFGYYAGYHTNGPPRVTDGQCCYDVDYCSGGCVGRPLIVGREQRVASLRSGDDWLAGEGLPGAPAGAVRGWLAQAWLDDALLEHSSVAAFARLSLELLALGAPAALVRETHLAALDEVEHARLCFGVASHLAGRELAPGPLDVSDSLAEKPSLARLAAATVREGCVGETIAALIASAQAEVAEVPAVRAALERIAADESRHAVLAYRLVAWAIRRGGEEVRRAVDSAFAESLAGSESEPGPTVSRSPAPAWRAWGRLSPDDARRVEQLARDEVISAGRRALLSEPLAARFGAAFENEIHVPPRGGTRSQFS